MTAAFPTLPGFAYNGDRIDCLLREFPNGHTMVITSQDGVSLPERGDWLACYYPGDWREDIEVEATGTWSNEDDFGGDPIFLEDLANELADGETPEQASRLCRLRSGHTDKADAAYFLQSEGPDMDVEFSDAMKAIMGAHKCPKCGTSDSIYARVDVKWSGTAWEVCPIQPQELECTNCDAEFQAEEAGLPQVPDLVPVVAGADECGTCTASTETRPFPCDECGHIDEED